MARLDEMLELAATRNPEGVAVRTGARTWTFAELAASSRRLASALLRVAAPGDRIALLGENSGEYVECYYGVPRAGLVLTLLNYRLHPAEWAHTIADAGATVVIGERALLDALAPEQLAPVRVVCIDGPGAGEIPYADLIDHSGTAELPAVRDTDVAWLIYTSGTTGQPKGAMLTHRSLLAAALNCALARPVQPDDVYLFPFPLCHVAGYNVLVFHLHARPVVMMRRFDAAAFLDLVARHRVTTTSLAPTMLDVLLDHPDFDAADLSSLRSIGYGAAAMPVPLLQRAVARFGADLAQGYGMTELSGNAVFMDGDAHRRAAAGDTRLQCAAGWCAPLAAIRILDDDGNDVAPGETGEIAVRGEQVMAGYWDDPDATAAAITDGWLRTGDLGRLDPDGLLSVVDRKKDVIVTGGENVASREVEAVLAAHPGVKEVAVVGVPDDTWGEEVCAIVVRTPGAPACSADDVVALSRAHLAGYKKPRHVLFVDALPVNAAGKIMKTELRALAAAALAHPHPHP